MRWDVPIYGADTWQDSKLVEVAETHAEGVRFITPGFDATTEEGRRFAEAYQQKYGMDPNFNAASAYDAMHILCEALKTELEAGSPLTGEKVRAAVLKVRFKGATGETTFSEDGEPAGKVFVRMVIQEGTALKLEQTEEVVLPAAA
jgi:branched-chain amino acid transport system substrate-binding protein